MRTETFDVVVIGGGVTGAGAALDAATRGLSVALVEMRDLAAGTSSRSSKLIHGGLRYLEQLDFGLVREALSERGRLLTDLAPHLVKPVSFLYPLTHAVWERPYVTAGVTLYDQLGGARNLPRHQQLSRRGALRLAPGLRRTALVGAIRYWDAQVDDARHTMEIARTAVRYGAAVATSARVVDVLREGERVAGVRIDDLEGGDTIDVRGRQVINATGVWTDDIQEMVGRGRIQVRASKGIHLVVPRDRFPSDSGIILRTETSVLFIIPWGRHWLIGTTDTDWELAKSHPAASATDIQYLLDRTNRFLRTPLTHDDVEGVYAGLRPLLSGESEDTSQLSREHAVASTVAGMVTIAGGKYTTYRVMAADAVDAASHGLAEKVPDSITERVPLLGATGYHAMWNQRHDLAAESGLHVARIEHLLDRYGSRTTELLDLVADDPELATPLPKADDYLEVEAHYAASHEGALHLDDVLTRRTRISIESWDRGLAAAAPVARRMAEVLDWDDETRERELAHYRGRVTAERDSQAMPDDRTADAARMGAPDVRTGAA
ncbi:glycerol-3-phosphate dehydrogenase/oxidase [Salsipaludibacter albus]|uniref:glycerol-3-phosphate dehydrogenase/oxidase n=1 Tax=Salsipaludibacter albus TaxID=2849650 RepID=UPI001EE498F0|nr:glycerol-3-phosphate dehydrogenase/oxidase [Salsipaludibacter albus]MBY5163377.1 glycerol-3-phosphate dehydrogenase/oxidase [Salsipaludibacter albus]